MKLPDYSRCVELNQLLEAMGVKEIPSVPPLPPDSFKREVVRTYTREELDPRDVAFDNRLKESVIPVNIEDITLRPDAPLELNGRKVCAYIRDGKDRVDFYNKISNYKYHLCNCSTIQRMKNIGREHRYLTTQRSDGFFEVHDLTFTPYKKGIARMELCKNCIDVLKRKGLYFTPFNLSEYFKRYDSHVPKTIRRIEEVREVQTYTPDQNDISREYRKACNYRCLSCSVTCKEDSSLLHLHHRNGDPSDNNPENLIVLCVDCHSNQPSHSHMKGNPKFKEQIKMIQNLRKAQDILTVSSLPDF